MTVFSSYFVLYSFEKLVLKLIYNVLGLRDGKLKLLS